MNRMIQHRRIHIATLLLSAALVLLASCTQEGEPTPQPVQPQPAILQLYQAPATRGTNPLLQNDMVAPSTQVGVFIVRAQLYDSLMAAVRGEQDFPQRYASGIMPTGDRYGYSNVACHVDDQGRFVPDNKKPFLCPDSIKWSQTFPDGKDFSEEFAVLAYAPWQSGMTLATLLSGLTYQVSTNQSTTAQELASDFLFGTPVNGNPISRITADGYRVMMRFQHCNTRVTLDLALQNTGTQDYAVDSVVVSLMQPVVQAKGYPRLGHVIQQIPQFSERWEYSEWSHRDSLVIDTTYVSRSALGMTYPHSDDQATQTSDDIHERDILMGTFRIPGGQVAPGQTTDLRNLTCICLPVQKSHTSTSFRVQLYSKKQLRATRYVNTTSATEVPYLPGGAVNYTTTLAL